MKEIKYQQENYGFSTLKRERYLLNLFESRRKYLKRLKEKYSSNYFFTIKR